MIDYDEKTNLVHYPHPMARYGLNPYGENLYRIVWGPSRQQLVCDGYGTARYVPTYDESVWVLEKWISGFQFCGMSPERYNRSDESRVNGPFPERGVYFEVHRFAACAPADANIDKLVSWVNEGNKRTPAEIAAAIRNRYEGEDRDTMRMAKDRLRNCAPAFGTAPMAGFGGTRGTKTYRITKSAREAGMPQSQGFRAA
jgi:hypothetical protein